MKKFLLFGLMSIPAFLFAQNKEIRSTVSDYNEDGRHAVQVDPNKKLSGAILESSAPKYKAQPYDFIQIGQTYYDLQTNHSVGTRIVLHDDGSISAVWTTSNDQNNDAFPNRGSGYNFYDGSDWGSLVSTRIENVRTGWPSIGVLGNGSEYILAHDATDGGFAFSTNGSVGGSTWNVTTPVLDDETVVGVDRAPIWNRSAALGDNLFVLSCYTISGGNDTATTAGVTTPVTFSRSTDNGQTWVQEHDLLPGYDNSLYVRGTADAYAMSAKDSVVAIVIGGYAEPVTLWKSTDYGANFTKIDVDNFPYTGTGQNQWFGDTLDGNDGSMDVILDANNDAHVFWGGCRYIRRVENGDTGVFFFPGTAYIGYWREGMSEATTCAFALDRDGNGQLDVTSETISGLTANGGIPTNVLTAARYNSNALLHAPSASIDANGNIYVVYSSPCEQTFSFLNANYRDVHIVYSEDGGDNWSTPQNITQDDYNEHTFASAAEKADDFVHIIWQRDDIPGTNLQNNSSSASNHLVTDNAILYAAIPTSAITGDQIGQHTVGVEPIQKAAKVFVVGQSYPNPTEGDAEVTIYLMNGSEIELTITDMFGKVVNSGSLGFMNAGNHVVNIDANGLSNGVYFYTLSTPDHSITKKMQVSK